MPITEWLKQWGNDGVEGRSDDRVQDSDSAEFDMIYRELKRIAHGAMARERSDHTLQATALVNEAFLRFSKQDNRQWHNRAHFFAIASMMMRRILVDYARERKRKKRGDPNLRLTFSTDVAVTPDHVDVLDLNNALDDLKQMDERHARIVEMRYFGGFTVDAISEVLGISSRTVKKDWRIAKAWLKTRLSGPT